MVKLSGKRLKKRRINGLICIVAPRCILLKWHLLDALGCWIFLYAENPSLRRNSIVICSFKIKYLILLDFCDP